MRFAFQVRDYHGRLQSGTVEAEHKDAVITRLLEQKYYIISLRDLSHLNKTSYFAGKMTLIKRIRSRDLIIFTRQLSAMLAAGLPILHCLDILWEQSTQSVLKGAVTAIKTDIEAGSALWETVARQPQIFSRVYINMLRAGELAGVMDVVLERLSYHLEREQEIKSKVKAASLYPLMISMLALLVVFFIIIWVMPRFAAIFESAGVQLPGPTRLLLQTGDYLASAGLYLLFGAMVLGYVLKHWGATPSGRLVYDNLCFRIPVVGKTFSKIAVARFARTLAILIKSGLPVLQALQVTEESVDNAIISRAISRACSSIKEGQTITAPFKESGFFEPMVTHMFAVGEETGRLEEMLEHLSTYYERELMHAVDYLTAFIEPVLILVVAILIGSVVVATLLPIFEMMNLVGS
ncbi:MAG: type II secretion system F family protein [Firmicutes bacterium]|nr:type II secretion system F family protein [Bacillota bacterium]